MTTSVTPADLWAASQYARDAQELAAAAADLAAWDRADREYDATAAGALDRRLDAAFAPTAHRHNLIECGMTDECRYGCKAFRCSCGETEIRHYGSYGCPIGRGEIEAARAGAR